MCRQVIKEPSLPRAPVDAKPGPFAHRIRRTSASLIARQRSHAPSAVDEQDTIGASPTICLMFASLAARPLVPTNRGRVPGDASILNQRYGTMRRRARIQD